MFMCEDKISVIVPVYKTEKYLNRCVNSLLNQTYTNLEIILVDDGSPDKCPEICDEYSKKDSRIKVIHKKNGGVSSARNAALCVAKGQYITFVDSDDFIAEEFVSSLYKALLEEKADISVCGMKMLCENDTVNCFKDKKVYRGKTAIFAYVSDEIRPEPWGKLITRTLFDGLIFNESIDYGEDLLLNYYLFSKAKCVVNIDKCLYNYEQRNEFAATTAYITESRIKSYRATKQMLKECENSDELKEIAVWRHVRGLFAIMSRLIFSNDTELFNKYYNILVDEVLKYIGYILSGNMYSIKYKVCIMILKFNRMAYVKMIKTLKSS